MYLWDNKSKYQQSFPHIQVIGILRLSLFLFCTQGYFALLQMRLSGDYIFLIFTLFCPETNFILALICQSTKAFHLMKTAVLLDLSICFNTLLKLGISAGRHLKVLVVFSSIASEQIKLMLFAEYQLNSIYILIIQS